MHKIELTISQNSSLRRSSACNIEQTQAGCDCGNGNNEVRSSACDRQAVTVATVRGESVIIFAKTKIEINAIPSDFCCEIRIRAIGIRKCLDRRIGRPGRAPPSDGSVPMLRIAQPKNVKDCWRHAHTYREKANFRLTTVLFASQFRELLPKIHVL